MPRLKRKRRQKRRDEKPFSRIRKPIPRPGTAFRSKKDYSRKKKHKKNWGEND